MEQNKLNIDISSAENRTFLSELSARVSELSEEIFLISQIIGTIADAGSASDKGNGISQ